MDFLDYPHERPREPIGFSIEESEPSYEFIEQSTMAVSAKEKLDIENLVSGLKKYTRNMMMPDEEALIYILIGFILGFVFSYLLKWICGCLCCRNKAKRRARQIHPGVPVNNEEHDEDNGHVYQLPIRDDPTGFYIRNETSKKRTKYGNYDGNNNKFMMPTASYPYPPSSPKILHQHQLIKPGEFGFSHHGANPATYMSGEVLSPSAPPVLDTMMYAPIHGENKATTFIPSTGFGHDGRWNGSP